MDLPWLCAAAVPTARKNKAKEIFMVLDVDESSVKNAQLRYANTKCTATPDKLRDLKQNSFMQIVLKNIKLDFIVSQKKRNSDRKKMY